MNQRAAKIDTFVPSRGWPPTSQTSSEATCFRSVSRVLGPVRRHELKTESSEPIRPSPKIDVVQKTIGIKTTSFNMTLPVKSPSGPHFAPQTYVSGQFSATGFSSFEPVLNALILEPGDTGHHGKHTTLQLVQFSSDAFLEWPSTEQPGNRRKHRPA